MNSVLGKVRYEAATLSWEWAPDSRRTTLLRQQLWLVLGDRVFRETEILKRSVILQAFSFRYRSQ